MPLKYESMPKIIFCLTKDFLEELRRIMFILQVPSVLETHVHQMCFLVSVLTVQGAAQPPPPPLPPPGDVAGACPGPRSLLSSCRCRRRRRRCRVVRGQAAPSPGARRLACRGAPGRSCAPGAASGLLRPRHGLLQLRLRRAELQTRMEAIGRP